MCEVIIRCKPRRKVRIVPGLLWIHEQDAPVGKTPQYRNPFLPRTKVILMLTMTASQKALLSVKFVDKKGNPAKVDGVPTWMTDNSDLLALQPGTDGLSCTVLAAGPIGTASVQVSADADLGEGVKPILGTIDVEITAGEATTVTIDAGAPEEQ